MFITEELRSKTARYLNKVEECANWLLEVSHTKEGFEGNKALWFGAERALHVAIECTTDAANDVIDALVMRDPGSYADILRVLAEESVVTREWFSKFEGALEYRDKLVHGYLTLTAEGAEEATRLYAPLLLEYARSLRSYLGMA